MSIPWIIFFVAFTTLNLGASAIMTSRIIDAIEVSSELDHSRTVYESEDVGTLTVYPREAILELADGTIIVIPKMEEAHEPA